MDQNAFVVPSSLLGRAFEPGKFYSKTPSVVCSAVSSSNSSRAVPGISSRVISFLIGIPPIWTAMRAASRALIFMYAEKFGVDWTRHMREIQRRIPEQDRDRLLAEVTDPELQYPEYYLKPFHGYKCGNLGWQPAFEAGPAGMAVELKQYMESETYSSTSALENFNYSRSLEISPVFDFYPDFRRELKSQANVHVVDGGCGVGMSSVLAFQNVVEATEGVPNVLVTGIDASPHMVAVAMKSQSNPSITYRHGLLEDTRLEDASIDMVCLQHTVHEIPHLEPIFKEAYRVLRKGGVLIVSDTDPKSRGLNQLHPAILTLLKATEPHCEEWWKFDMEEVSLKLGFSECNTIMASGRHRSYFLRK